MTLQARLTLYYVLLAVLMVTTISAINLGNEMQAKFEDTLKIAQRFQQLAVDVVIQALNSDRKVAVREALRKPSLVASFQNIMSDSRIEELAVVDPSNNEILLDSIPGLLGQPLASYADFEPLVTSASWFQKFQALRSLTGRYQLKPIELEVSTPYFKLSVRAIIKPKLIEDDILPSLKQNGKVALVALVCSVLATFLFSKVAFRPLGELRHQLDMVTAGQFEPEASAESNPGSDEFSVMASKVSLLGQRLRGAQFEVSDLRGNIDRLLQDLEDAVFIFNRERRLVFASGSVERFLGNSRVDLPGRSMDDIFPPSTTLGLLISQAAEMGRMVRNRRVPATFASEGNAVSVVLLSVDLLETLPGTTHAGSGILVRLRDPEVQRKIGRELQTADRLAAISRVSSGVAHEVKNPLNAILLHVEVAKAKLAAGDTDVAPQMEIIAREILRLDRVVKTFLDFTRPVELNISQVPVQELVNEVVDLAKPQAAAGGIRVVVHQEAEGVDIRIDRDLLKQAVLNIVVNAMQAMPEGGELTFESLASEEFAEIRIKDTCAGIPPELKDKIFRLYYTTKKDGSGIGLAMTFRIVQLHDGTIEFNSEPGKGTTFLVRLPIAV